VEPPSAIDEEPATADVAPVIVVVAPATEDYLAAAPAPPVTEVVTVEPVIAAVLVAV